MTDEEAMSILSGLVTHYNAFSEESAAICKAMEALEERTQTHGCDSEARLTHEERTDEDLIYRNDIRKILINLGFGDDENGSDPEYMEALWDVRDELEKLLPVNPAKVGHWIEHKHECGENWEYSKYECNICHVWSEDDSDYCPSCGSKMEVDE